MKRRKKPRASNAPRERDPAQASGLYPYLVRFLEWSAARAYQQQRLLPLRAFFKWLARENLILSNPASELELPRVHRRGHIRLVD